FALVMMILVRYVIQDHKRKTGGLPVPHDRFLVLAGASLVVGIGLTAAWGAASAPFALLFGTGAVLGFVNPVIAAGVLVSTTILRPWELEGLAALAVIPKLSGALCGFSWIYHGWRKKELTFLWSWPVRVFSVFALWVLLSAMFSGDAAMQEYNNTLLIAAILFFMVLNIANDAFGVHAIRRAVVVSVAGAISCGMVMTLTRPDYNLMAHRLYSYGLLGNPNDLAAMISLALPLLMIPTRIAHRSSRRTIVTAAVVAMAILMASGLWLSQSRGAFAGLVLTYFAYRLARSARPLRGFLITLICLPFAGVALSLLSLARDSGDLSASSESRWSYVVAGFNMAIRNPIMGVGFGGYPRNFESYASNMTHEWGERTAHSSWVLVMAENGFLGLFLFGTLFLLVLRESWRLRTEYPELLAALVGYGVTMSFLSHTYTFFPYLIFALILAATKTRKTAVLQAPRSDRDKIQARSA
ncbi:MAG TPA: O-antigen ligase family protein, partial [Bdellovibrionota bacterium]|nr:O-antigen ligase family protein [Bdellovibrionota bacterium]